MKLTHFAKVESGAVKFNNRKLFDKELAGFEGKEIEITIQKRKKRRSNNQNRFYHGVIVPMCLQGLRDLGHHVADAEECHEILKAMFNKKRIIDKETGEVISEYGGSTAKMTTSEMQDYWADIMQWSAEMLNVVIPDPREIYGDGFVKEMKKAA